MRAAICTRYGPPGAVEIVDRAKPAPGENDVLVRVRATTVTSGDARVRGANFGSPIFWLPGRLMLGLRGPRQPILGTEFSGEVAAVGGGVTAFAVGDAVFGFSDLTFGAHAEYVCLPASGNLAAKPAAMRFDEAAAIPFGATTALYFLRDRGRIAGGQSVLIIGASGAVGTAAVQLAKHFGARVAGVCSTANVELVRSLGADRVFDYMAEDFAAGGEIYDIIFDTVGKATFARCKGVLAPQGMFLAAVGGLRELLQMTWTAMADGRKVRGGVATGKPEDIRLLGELMEAGTLRAVIDRTYPLEEIAAAHAYVEGGHKRGSVVISMSGSEGGEG